MSRPQYEKCETCGSDEIFVDHADLCLKCTNCGASQPLDQFSRCPECLGVLHSVRSSTLGDRKVQERGCRQCSYKVVVYAAVVTRTPVRFRRGRGFAATVHRLLRNRPPT